MKITTSTLFILGMSALLAGVVLLVTKQGYAQDHVLPFPQPLLVSELSDSWQVDVKNACLVDAVKVSAGSIPSTNTQNFETNSFTNDPNEAAGTPQGKAACEEAKKMARSELPGLLWAEGDKLCHEWKKAPPKKDDKECVAVRGNLQADTITCSCDFSKQDPSHSGSTRKWKATAKCTAPDVKYVCDP